MDLVQPNEKMTKEEVRPPFDRFVQWGVVIWAAVVIGVSKFTWSGLIPSSRVVDVPSA